MPTDPIIASPPGGAQLSALRRVDPTRWQEIVRLALHDAGPAPGRAERAAETLGVHRRTLDGWIHDVPALRDGIAIPRPGHPRAVVR